MDSMDPCVPSHAQSYDTLRARARACLAEAGWTQADAARALGYDTDHDWSYVRRVLSGHETSRRLLLRLLALLDAELPLGVETGATKDIQTR